MEDILRSGLAELGVAYDGASIDKLTAFSRFLLERNRVMDLTAITGEEDTARLHLLDSAALIPCAGFDGARVVDVGTGAGFPGMPIALLCPTAQVTLLDSLGKRVDFLREASELLGLENVTCLCARAEETPELRESFDVAVSRAVARLSMLCELCLPLVRPGGLFIAMKGPDCADEAAEAESAVRELGGKVRQTRLYTVPGTDVTHAAVVIEKLTPTPARYPRRFARIKAKPL